MYDPEEKNAPSLEGSAEGSQDFAFHLTAIQEKWINIFNIPPNIKNYDKLCEEAVKQKVFSLKNAPSNQQPLPFALYKAAVEKSGVALRFIPPTVENYEMLCEKAVKQNVVALRFIPPTVKNYDKFCEEAIKQNYKALQYVNYNPPNPANPPYELCLMAVKINPYAIEFVPVEKRTYDLCRSVVKQAGVFLEYISLETERYADLCFDAVKENGLNLEYVKGPQSYNLCLAAVQQDGNALKFISSATDGYPDLCLEAVKQNGGALEFIPPTTDRYKELCLEAIKESWLALKYVLPKDPLPYNLCLEAVKQDGNALAFIPPTTDRYKELCMEAVKNIGFALKHVLPKEPLPHELCTAAVEQNGLALCFVPVTMRDEVLCRKAVEKSGLAIQSVPKDVTSYSELCLVAVKQDGLALEHIPPEIENYAALCEEAVKQNGTALQFVPENLKGEIIQKLTVEGILTNNYLSRQYFPKQPDFTNDIDTYLRSVEYVVVNSSPKDHELHDIHLVYIHNKNEKKKKSVSIVSENPDYVDKDLKKLLQDISLANKNHPSKDLHLAFVGHSNEQSKKLAGMHFKKMSEICINNKNVKHIHLLGCNVAKAKKPAAEKAMLDKLIQKMQMHSQMHAHLKYGVMGSVNFDITSTEKQLLKYFEKKTNNYDGLYIINRKKNEKKGYDYQLIFIKYDKENKQITPIIMAEKISQEHIIREDSKKSGVLVYFDIGLDINCRENQTLSAELATIIPLPSGNDLLEIELLADPKKRFEKGHSKYEEDKQMYSFLNKIEVEPWELEPSLLKRLADELIRRNEDIEQDVTLHGPTKVLHVDTAKRNLKVARTYLYNSQYTSSFIESKLPNLNYSKLDKERNALIQKDLKQRMEETRETKETKEPQEPQETTNAKQLKTTIKSEIKDESEAGPVVFRMGNSHQEN